MGWRIGLVLALGVAATLAWGVDAGAGERDKLLEVLSIEEGCISKAPRECGLEQMDRDSARFIKMAVGEGLEEGYFHLVDGMCGREAYWRCRLGSEPSEVPEVYEACMTLFIRYRALGGEK